MAGHFCEVCLDRYEELHARQRGVFWDALPESLGTVKWEELLTDMTTPDV
jgi:hypothetical protein